MDSFKGKTAFVTGGTSGIGRAAAVAFGRAEPPLRLLAGARRRGKSRSISCETLAAMALSSR